MLGQKLSKKPSLSSRSSQVVTYKNDHQDSSAKKEIHQNVLDFVIILNLEGGRGPARWNYLSGNFCLEWGVGLWLGVLVYLRIIHIVEKKTMDSEWRGGQNLPTFSVWESEEERELPKWDKVLDINK